VTLVILDTCIIQAAGDANKSKSESLLNLFDNLSTEGYKLAISEISVFENLHGLWGKKAAKASESFNKLVTKVVSREVLVLASILGGLYKDLGGENISAGDKIIGSTAILENGLVMTENHKDFPPPLWFPRQFFQVTYSKNHYRKTLDIGLYEPRTEVINRKISENEKLNR